MAYEPEMPNEFNEDFTQVFSQLQSVGKILHKTSLLLSVSKIGFPRR